MKPIEDMENMVRQRVMGSKHCKDICSRFKTKRPWKDPYKTHYNCRRCEYWGDKKSLTEFQRCPCCNFRPRMKTWYSMKAKELYNPKRI
jgi:hypothetical protein